MYCWIAERILRNRGFLYGPWLPIYGIGALGIYAMKPVEKHPVLQFILCAVVVGSVEYSSAILGFPFSDYGCGTIAVCP